MKNRRRYANNIARQNRVFELRYFPRAKAAIQSKVNDLRKVIEEGGLSAGFDWLSKDLSNPELVKVVGDIYRTVGLFHARNEERRLRQEIQKKDFQFTGNWLDTILDYLRRFMLDKLTFKVNDETRKQLYKVLVQAQTEGWGIDKITAALSNMPFTEVQAARIVRTEVTRATGAGMRAQAKTFKYQTSKEWISVRDFRTRGVNPKDHANHVLLNGIVVDEEDYFQDPKNGDFLRFPGDPNASAASVINCRCVVATVPKRDENGKLIPKQRVSVIIPGQIPQRQTILI